MIQNNTLNLFPDIVLQPQDNGMQLKKEHAITLNKNKVCLKIYLYLHETRGLRLYILLMNYNRGSTIYHKNLSMQNAMIKRSQRNGHAKIGTSTHMKNSSTTSMN